MSEGRDLRNSSRFNFRVPSTRFLYHIINNHETKAEKKAVVEAKVEFNVTEVKVMSSLLLVHEI